MKIVLTQPLFIFLSLCTLLIACDQSQVRDTASEVSEEGTEFIQAIGPDEAVPPLPPAPEVQITPQETLSEAQAAGGLLRLSPTVATAIIDRWLATLGGNLHIDDTDLMVVNLRRLRDLLQAETIDRNAVHEVLEALAQETRQAADDADNAAVEALGDALHEAAEALE